MRGRKQKESATVRAVRVQLHRRLKAICAERAQLYALRDDIDELVASCDDAADALETAIEALSRYV